MTGSATLSINVLDMNDNGPILAPYDAPVVNTDTRQRAEIVRIRVVDADGPDNRDPFTLVPCQQSVGCTDFEFFLEQSGKYLIELQSTR